MVATEQQLNYISSRKKYARPQAIAFTEGYDSSESGILVPTGYEFGSEVADNLETFLILSDHNRSNIDISSQRLGTRERMINGRMRAYHIDDKKTIRLSWQALPSRSYSSSPEFMAATGLPTTNASRTEYTADGGAGGADIKKWYDDHVDSFWVLLAYDNYADLEGYADITKYDRLAQYTEAVEMYISDFSFNVEKRGSTNHDLWSVSMSLEEA
jgi:hypothetical protein